MNLSAAIDRAKASEFKDDEAAEYLAPFLRWCESRGVRSCPASPQTVAAFVSQTSVPYGVQATLNTLRSIEIWHDSYNYPNPVSTAAVRRAVAEIVEFTPPRSWSKADRELLRTVSPSVQSIIAKREAERDRQLHRKFNQLHETQKRLQAGTEKPAEVKKENTDASERL